MYLYVPKNLVLYPGSAIFSMYATFLVSNIENLGVGGRPADKVIKT